MAHSPLVDAAPLWRVASPYFSEATDRWLDDGKGPPWPLVHTACGERTGIELHCTSCGEPLGLDVGGRPRPGSWARDRKRSRKPLRPTRETR